MCNALHAHTGDCSLLHPLWGVVKKIFFYLYGRACLERYLKYTPSSSSSYTHPFPERNKKNCVAANENPLYGTHTRLYYIHTYTRVCMCVFFYSFTHTHTYMRAR